ncbi:hypothetical protein D3C72_625590 [compost metagenome]
MAIFTKQQFESIARSKAGYSGLRGIVNETRTFSKSTAITSIFLSHSHTDRAIVEQAKVFFENLGISIYVDWADETMPERANGVTASRIKSKIHSNDKFVLLATNAAVVSKWCNWEVGIGDTYKLYNKKIALLPLADNSGMWNGNEYLQIYPRIEKSSLYADSYNVHYPDGSIESLTAWLKK